MTNPKNILEQVKGLVISARERNLQKKYRAAMYQVHKIVSLQLLIFPVIEKYAML